MQSPLLWFLFLRGDAFFKADGIQSSEMAKFRLSVHDFKANLWFIVCRYKLLTVIPRTASAGKFLAKLAESEESLVSFCKVLSETF